MFRIGVATVVVWCLAGAPLVAQDGTPSFANRASDAGVEFDHANPTFFTMADYTGGGTVADFDRDGAIDLFAVSGGNGLDHLYINNGDGTFTDSASAWGMTTVHLGKGATSADYNDDGWPDMFVTSAGPVGGPAAGHHKLFRNNGNSSFTDVASEAGVAFSASTEDGFCSAFGDYDLDGDLDLFVAGWKPPNKGSRLFQNDGDGTFTDVTNVIDFWAGTPITVYGFAPRFVDMDGDKYPELLLVGDFGTSRYFQNDGDGTFTDVTNARNAGQDENGMGQTVGDFNNDGLFDWYVCSIFAPTVSWTGNKLYLNTPSGVLEEVGEAAGVEEGGYGWGAVSVDFDHDGFLDIAETNGDNASPMFINEQSYLFMNQGDGTFSESALSLGLDHSKAGRGMLNFDYDDDGDQDIAIFTNFSKFTLWNNDLSGNEIAWLRVFLDTTVNDELAADGYGTVISARVGTSTQYRHVFGGDNYLSSSELSAHFGLGAATSVDELRVEWSNGEVTVLKDVAVNQTIVVTPPEDDHWTRVGLGIGGENGVPQIRGTGDLVGGTPATLSLNSARPSSPFCVVLSTTVALTPYQGGVLVPSPDYVAMFSTDTEGAWSATVPPATGIPVGTKLWFQAWQQDPTGVMGWISSNGLRATTESLACRTCP
jgi:hypothetical protein